MKAHTKKPGRGEGKLRPGGLFRDGKNKLLGGVVSGIGKYLGIEPAAIRIAFLAFVFLIGLIDGFRGIFLLFLIYILAWLFIPSSNE